MYGGVKIQKEQIFNVILYMLRYMINRQVDAQCGM